MSRDFFLKNEKNVALKRDLILDLQTFMWSFEQEGYTRQAMQQVLSSYQNVLQDHAKKIGGYIEDHLLTMLADCNLYVKGKANPKKIVGDLDQLRQDLEM